MNWLRRFITEPAPREIKLANVQADEATVGKLAARQAEVRAAMGRKWAAHPRNTTVVSQTQLLRDWEDAIAENASRAGRHVVTFHRRKV